MKEAEQRIVYRCLPHLQLEILENKEAKVEIGGGEYFASSNILVEEADPHYNRLDNKIFLLQDGVEGWQEITANK